MRLFTKLLIVFYVFFALSSILYAKVIDNIKIPYGTNLSLAIYDGTQIVKIIYELKPVEAGQTISIEWDGKDFTGADMPAGAYYWKAILSNARGYDDGFVGDNAPAPYNYLTEYGTFIQGIAFDTNGDVYETSPWEEAHQEIRVWSKDGIGLRYIQNGGGIDIKVDDKYVYQLAMKDNIATAVYRFDKNNLKERTWFNTFTGCLKLDDGITAVDVDDTYIWIASNSRVQVKDKETMVSAVEFELNNTRGIVINKLNGNAWISNSGDKVTEFNRQGQKLREIAGITDPRNLAIGGPENNLYVANMGDYPVIQYDISGNILFKLVREMFRQAKPGRVYDDAFLWRYADTKTGLAVNKEGDIATTDLANYRVMIYDNDLNTIMTRFSEMVTAPMINVDADPNILTSQNIEYIVNYYPGPDYGKWIVYNNWSGTRGNVRVRVGDRMYLYSVGNPEHLDIFDITDGTMRRCGAIIGSNMVTYRDINEDGTLTEDEIINGQVLTDGVVKFNDNLWMDKNGKMWVLKEKVLIVWNDKNSDGIKVLDELSFYPCPGQISMLAPGMWVDTTGTWWAASWDGATVKASMQGLDENNNPIYNFDDKITIIPRDESRLRFRPTNIRIDPVNGDIYRIGNASGYNRTRGPGFWMGGTMVTRHTSDGELISYIPVSDGYDAVVIATDTDGQYFYQGFSEGDQIWVKAYTNDGLLAAVCRLSDGPSGPSGGWMDHGLSMSAFTHPDTGVHYVYSEEVFWGKSVRFRIDNLDEINDTRVQRRGEGTFNWTT